MTPAAVALAVAVWLTVSVLVAVVWHLLHTAYRGGLR